MIVRIYLLIINAFWQVKKKKTKTYIAWAWKQNIDIDTSESQVDWEGLNFECDDVLETPN